MPDAVERMNGLLEEAAEYVRTNRESFRDAEQWLSERFSQRVRGRDCWIPDAWTEAKIQNDPHKFLFIIYFLCGDIQNQTFEFIPQKVLQLFTEESEGGSFQYKMLNALFGEYKLEDDYRIRRALKEAAKGFREKAHRPALGEVAGWIYEKLKSLPEHQAMILPQIADWLANEKNHILDEDTIRKNHLKQLKPYGLQHKKRIGYYIR